MSKVELIFRINNTGFLVFFKLSFYKIVPGMLFIDIDRLHHFMCPEFVVYVFSVCFYREKTEI